MRMSDRNGGQLAARQLKAAGIDTIFGVVAGPMIEVLSGAVEEGIRVVNCRHEVSAGFAASAWGWVKRKPGVCVVGSGPALTNAVTPMHVATESAMPLVVLGGSTYGPTRGLGGFQEADQRAFARPACKWTLEVDSTERIPELVHLACGRAVGGRPGAVYLDFPGHLVSRRIGPERVRIRERQPEIAAPHPDPDAIARVADALAGAERPLLLVGKGAAWSGAGAALAKLADRGFPYVTSPMARGTIPDDHPGFVNGARSGALKGADVIVMVGGRFNWIFGFGGASRFAPDVRLFQIDVEAEELTSGADLELGLVADAAQSARALDAALGDRALRCADGRWLAALAEARDANEAKLRPAMQSDASPIDPHRLVAEVRDALPRDASVAVDGETIMGIARQIVPSYGERRMFNAGTTGCMGTGVPYALGAKLARPDAPSVAILGDYAFGAAALEVETAARVGAPVVFVVANNEGIAGHSIQDGMFPPGAPRIASLLPAHYEKLGELVDGHVEKVEKAAEIRPALERALAADRVAVVHVRVDPKATRLSGGVYLR
jgi:thiamine pyrophosphate-dependent acetolactate synthase large subunit-like protein